MGLNLYLTFFLRCLRILLVLLIYGLIGEPNRTNLIGEPVSTNHSLQLSSHRMHVYLGYVTLYPFINSSLSMFIRRIVGTQYENHINIRYIILWHDLNLFHFFYTFISERCFSLFINYTLQNLRWGKQSLCSFFSFFFYKTHFIHWGNLQG